MSDNLGILIPESIANYQLPDDSLLSFYQNLEERILWVSDEINVYSLELINHILKWNREDKGLAREERKPIRLLFFSPGGDIDVYQALYDIVKMSKTPVIGINISQCCSAAAYIFLACHKRYMLPHAYFLYHQGSSSMAGDFNQIISAIQDYQDQVSELSSVMLQHTKYTKEEIENNITGEWYIRAEEAIEKGVCDRIVTDLDELL